MHLTAGPLVCHTLASVHGQQNLSEWQGAAPDLPLFIDLG